MNIKLLLTKISYLKLSTVGLDTQQTYWRIRSLLTFNMAVALI